MFNRVYIVQSLFILLFPITVVEACDTRLPTSGGIPYIFEACEKVPRWDLSLVSPGIDARLKASMLRAKASIPGDII